MAKVKSYDPGNASGRAKPRQASFSDSLNRATRNARVGADVSGQMLRNRAARGMKAGAAIGGNLGTIIGLGMRGGRPQAKPKPRQPQRSSGPNFFDQILNAGKGVGMNFADLLRQQEPQGYEQFQFGPPPSPDQFSAGSIDELFGSQLQGFANQRADLEKRKAEALAEIQRSFGGVANQMLEGRGEVDSAYAAQEQAAKERAAAAQAAINQGAESSAANIAQSAQALGTADAIDNTQAERDRQFYAAQQAAQSEQAGNSLGATRADTFQYNTAIPQFTRQQGSELGAAYGRDYDSAIAQLLDEEQQFRAEAQQQARQEALQRYQIAATNYRDQRDFQYGEWLRNQEWNREDAQNALQWELEQQSRQGDPYNPYGDYQTDADKLRARLLQEGVSDPKVSDWLSRGRSLANQGLNRQAFMQKFGGSPGVNSALEAYFQDRGYFR